MLPAMPTSPTTASPLSALELAEAIRHGTTTATALVESQFQHIRSHDGDIRAFISLNEEQALETAAIVDAEVQAGRADALPLLAGVPIGIKDNLNVSGTRTTCASKMLETYVSPYDATVIQKVKAHHMPIMGKANMDEFAMGSSCEKSAFFPTANPWNTACVPGGSSGGSAACVASGMVPISLGSDTGGSVRQPASLCGIVGLKPTYGLVSRYGLVAFASSLDQVSPFARTVEDTAAILQIIAGRDGEDMTSSAAPETLPDYLHAASAQGFEGFYGKTPLRVGVVQGFEGEGIQAGTQAAMHQAVQQFEAMGAQVKSISITGFKEAIAAYYIIATAEASSNLSRFDGVRYGLSERENVENVYDMFAKTRAKGFGSEVKRRILLGAFALSAGYYDAYYGKAQLARQVLAKSFDAAWQEVDVLICPTSPSVAFEMGAKNADPISMYLSDIATIPVNLVGIPAISVPCGFDEPTGLPIGLQIMAPRWQEDRLLAVSHAFQERCGIKNVVPARFELPTPSAATV
jgi:aspartyl-tRNA(Asn)/glutamyl-tRNA(Gln) amidotransferase subunit A